MIMEYIAITGWALALIMVGLWWGEKGRRIFVQNYTTFGGTPLKKAKVWSQEDAESRLEDEIDRIQNIGGAKMTRVGPSEPEVKFTRETLETGVQFLLDEALARGEQLSRAEAQDEAARMLNAEDGEM